MDVIELRKWTILESFPSRRCVLLESPSPIAEVLVTLEKYYTLLKIVPVNLLIDFDYLIHKNKRCLAAGTNRL